MKKWASLIEEAPLKCAEDEFEVERSQMIAKSEEQRQEEEEIGGGRGGEGRRDLGGGGEGEGDVREERNGKENGSKLGEKEKKLCFSGCR